ncbi:hypothetical protein CN933_11070 [Sinorhizobium sp. M4_45]|nr:hypothetical protein CN933_11070 [Sinorhizobium sp. M4_45]
MLPAFRPRETSSEAPATVLPRVAYRTRLGGRDRTCVVLSAIRIAVAVVVVFPPRGRARDRALNSSARRRIYGHM